MADSTEAWESFFKSCEVPATQWKKYAHSFVKQRIQPHLLRDLSKEDLRELGINALGDQLAIIRYVKLCDGSPPEFGGSRSSGSSAKKQQQAKKPPERKRTSRSATYSDDDEEPMAVDVAPPRSMAPDRHDIYHVKMPDGNSQRTKNILEMHSALKEQGLIKRGVSGVRQSGIELHKVATKSKTIQKLPTKPTKPAALVVQDTDVTSSSTVPVGTLRSDLISTKTTVVRDSPLKKHIFVNRVSNSARGGGVTIPIQVQLDIPQMRRKVQKPFRQAPRKIVSYGRGLFDEGDFIVDDEQDEEEEEEVMEMLEPAGRLPIAERIQVIDRQRGGSRARRAPLMGHTIATAAERRRRPMVTVGGRKINLGGGGQKFQTGRSGRGGHSILDRITF